MDSIVDMAHARDWAAELGWTKIDGERALSGAHFPIDKIDALNKMVRFAGPELINRQNLQKAQKGQVTKTKKKIESLELELIHTIDTYEEKLDQDRSQFIAIIKTIYGFLAVFGYKDHWIEALVNTYDDHLNQTNSDDTPNQAA